MMISCLRRLILLLMCIGATVSVAGCGNSTSEVSGTITLKGGPPNFKGLDIGFLGSNGRLVTAPIGTDGKYKAVGVPVGEVQVNFIYTPPASASGKGKPRLLRPGPNGAPPPPNPDMAQSYNPIPQHLREGSTSKLSCKVVSGPNNVFNYDIQP